MMMTELERQQEHYKRIRERIWSTKPKPVLEIKKVPIKPLRPQWVQMSITFDAHVLAYLGWKADQGSPKRAYIRRRAEELGYTYDDIAGYGRKRKLVADRHLIIWEVKSIWPKASFPELGRLLGGRDHTTILYAYEKIEAQMRCDL